MKRERKVPERALAFVVQIVADEVRSLTADQLDEIRALVDAETDRRLLEVIRRQPYKTPDSGTEN